MSAYIGFDTSNYTTSIAGYTPETDGMCQIKKLLTVKEGEMGLRQNDAVFQHIRQLPELAEQFLSGFPRITAAVGASERPTQQDGSYMPCFLIGASTARTVAATLGVPYYRFTHQQGHVAAALYGTKHTEWLERPFLAFHVSGGTTDALLIEPDEKEIIRCTLVAHSLDLKAGQLVDRVGGMLGLRFPAGPELEKLALQASGNYKPRIKVENGGCHLSGVENQCRKMLDDGTPPPEVALFCLMSIYTALQGMTQYLFATYGDLPLVYAGGVMSNGILKEKLSAEFGGVFAPPVYSADNAAGIALLTSVAHNR